MQVKKYPAQAVTGCTAQALSWSLPVTSAFIPSTHILVGLFAALAAMLLCRQATGAVRASQAALWRQMLLLAQRLDTLEPPPLPDDGRDFIYPATKEVSHG